MGENFEAMNARDRMVRDVSRTFALSIEVLPAPLRESIGIAYLLFRISDGIEDHDEMSVDRKVALLDQWAAILEGIERPEALVANTRDLDTSDPENNIIQQTELVLQWLHALPAEVQQPIVQHVYDTTRGMARWQRHGPTVADEAELDDYMHEVAGRVGYLVTDLFALHSPAIAEQRDELMPLSRECGLALQTVNVIRGMRKDYERGWVFTPQSYMDRVGLTADTLFDPACRPQALQVVSMLADKADRHLDYGLDYVQSFPRREHRIRLALMWPFFFAVRTLALSRSNPAVLGSEAKMTRAEVQQIVVQTRLMGWSNSWLDTMYRRLSAVPVNSPVPRPQVTAPNQELPESLQRPVYPGE
jgi:farnesyl-diphosphate farnesyltransferase